MSDPGPPLTPSVVLAQRVRFNPRMLRPSVWLWPVAGVSLLITVPVIIRTDDFRWTWFTVGLTVSAYVGMTWLQLKPTTGSAWADPDGIHWSGKWGDYSYPWQQINWIELAADQPGAALFNRLNPGSTVRTGTQVGITLVANDGAVHYIHPMWTAADSNRIAFGCELAAYARTQGVRVRVLQGDWGTENANKEPTHL